MTAGLNKLLLPPLMALLFFVSGSCSSQEWQRLNYYYNSGALPPPYHYSYNISITSDGAGELTYVKGYDEKGKNKTQLNFTLGKKQMKELKRQLKISGVLTDKIKERRNEEIPDGGHSDNLTVYSDSEPPEIIASVPSYPDLKYVAALNKLYEYIVSCVPNEYWNEVNGINGD